MRIICAKDYDDMSRKAADIIAAQVIMKPDCVLGLATGSSPIGIYNRLVAKYESEDLDFSKVKTVNLDEYCGLDLSSNQSYVWFMHHYLFDRINIDPADTHFPDGMEEDSDKSCRDYDEVLEKVGRQDLQLLGLGPDGHIGFNEPEDFFPAGTHKVTLTESTIQANKRFVESEDLVPRFAYTMGIAGIMRARRILMIVSGKNKAAVLKEALTGPIVPKIPASVLQLHPNFILVADQDALSELEKD